MKKGHRVLRGFTIVEVLVVIIVIAIIATISVIAYQGVQQRAHNAATLVSHTNVADAFRLYRSLKGTYPLLPNNTSVCVGAEFPDVDGDGVGDCRNLTSADPAYRHSQNAWLDAELRSVSDDIAKPSNEAIGDFDLVGPYAQYYPGLIIITNVYYGNSSSECPDGMTFTWKQPNKPILLCQIRLTY